jgi:GDPmannose 4,6-dehydratase
MSLKNKNVLITGISGFAGSHLAKYLVDIGAGVYGLVQRRADGTTPKNLIDRGIAGEVHLLEGSLEDIASLGFALDASQPDVVFHLAAQSFVPRSFTNPTETAESNAMGTANLLEAIRLKDCDPKVVYAGSSEEYGLVIVSREQLQNIKKKYGSIFPEPARIPEVPISEENPLRPMSPYAVSKVYGDYLMRNYYYSYGMRDVVSRGFNHEGAGRGIMFVTSVISNQIMKLKFGEANKITIGNVNAFRDWSHIMDIVKGYCLLAEKGRDGDVYNQGSQRTNSVLSYILLGLQSAGYSVERIEAVAGGKRVSDPNEIDKSKFFGVSFEKTRVDKMMLNNELEYFLSDRGIHVYTDKGKILIEFDTNRFRPAEVPILLSSTGKIQKMGYAIKHRLEDIIKDQLNYFMDRKNRV